MPNCRKDLNSVRRAAGYSNVRYRTVISAQRLTGLVGRLAPVADATVAHRLVTTPSGQTPMTAIGKFGGVFAVLPQHHHGNTAGNGAPSINVRKDKD